MEKKNSKETLSRNSAVRGGRRLLRVGATANNQSIKRHSRLAAIGSNFLLAAVGFGCSGAPEDEDGEFQFPDEGAVAGDTEEPLLGNITTGNCLAAEQTFATNVLNDARFVAVSPGLAECIQTTMNATQQLARLSGTTATGPYNACTGDPFASSARSTQIQQAIFAARSTNDVRLVCTTQATPVASTSVGSFNTQDAESMLVHQQWRNFAASDTPLNRRQAANAIWHEGMHQWGYKHAGNGITCPAQANTFQSVSEIVGNCMETIMMRGTTACSNGGLCSPNARRIKRYLSDACDCVNDPKLDVGVVVDAGFACPTDELRVFMDDEDDSNENSRGGWRGKIVSDSNTTLFFCRMPGRSFRQIPSSSSSANYAVLRMGTTCPLGSVAFSRTFDNEDDDNINSFSGHIRPSRSDSNTQLQFCMFRANASASAFTFPQLGASSVPYGVLAGSSLPNNLGSGFVKTDDEDSSNENSLSGDTAGSSVFLTADNNTVMRFARVR